MQAERALLEGEDRREILARLPVCMTPAQLHELQGSGWLVRAYRGAAVDYVQALLAFSRQSSRFRAGYRRAPDWGCWAAGLGIAAPSRPCAAGRRASGAAGGGGPSPAPQRRSSINRPPLWSGSCWMPWRCRPEVRPPCSGVAATLRSLGNARPAAGSSAGSTDRRRIYILPTRQGYAFALLLLLLFLWSINYSNSTGFTFLLSAVALNSMGGRTIIC